MLGDSMSSSNNRVFSFSLSVWNSQNTVMEREKQKTERCRVILGGEVSNALIKFRGFVKSSVVSVRRSREEFWHGTVAH